MQETNSRCFLFLSEERLRRQLRNTLRYPRTPSHFAKTNRIVLEVSRQDLRRYNVTFSFRAMTTVGRRGSKSINPLNGPFFLPLPPPLTGNTTLPTAAIHRDTLWHS